MLLPLLMSLRAVSAATKMLAPAESATAGRAAGSTHCQHRSMYASGAAAAELTCCLLQGLLRCNALCIASVRLHACLARVTCAASAETHLLCWHSVPAVCTCGQLLVLLLHTLCLQHCTAILPGMTHTLLPCCCSCWRSQAYAAAVSTTAAGNWCSGANGYSTDSTCSERTVHCSCRRRF